MGTFDGTNSRKVEIQLRMIEELANMPDIVGYDVNIRISTNNWTKCRDEDIISSIFRGWREDANRLHLALRRNVEWILRTDIKGENATEDDKYKRSRYMDNIEEIVGKGNGEEYLISDPDTRWKKLLIYLRNNNIFPREKELGSNVYMTVDFDGHLSSQRKSIDRAHNQIRNQNQKNVECFVDLGKLNKSQMLLVLAQNEMKIESCFQSVELHKIQNNIILKRLVTMDKDENFKKLVSPDYDKHHDESKPFDLVDIEDILHHDEYGSEK